MMTRRPGITLVEVLVAILITGVGLLALLTLFPLGLLQTAEAIQADRVGHVKHNAIAVATTWGLRNDTDVKNAMLDPNGTASVQQYPFAVPQATLSTQPSYPVLVDPNGYWANRGTAWQDWVAGGPANTTNPTFVLPRRVSCDPLKLNSPTPSGGTMMTDTNGRRQQLLRWTALLDDMTFPRDVGYTGRPCLPPNGSVDRVARYSWAYLCRMPKVVPNGPVYVTVIVYSGRALEQPTTGETAFSADYGFDTNGTPTPSLVTLRWNAGQDPPDVSVGGWLFDAQMVPDPRGYFYRIVSMNQTGTTSMEVEVQLPDGTPKLLATGLGGIAVIMDNVIGVFDFKTF